MSEGFYGLFLDDNMELNVIFIDDKSFPSVSVLTYSEVNKIKSKRINE